MKREIKFRIYRPAIGEMQMVTQIMWGNLVSFGGISSISTGQNDVDPDKVHLMQFTGLLDKSGKEIFEGDLFQVANNNIYQVKYCNGAESDFEWYGAMFILWLNDDTFFPFDDFAMKNGSIIGNIYENQELLNK